MNYAIVTFGCRVNQADSLELEERLRAAGARATLPTAAEVVVVNTCSVTAHADQGARQTIRRIARDNPAARIVVTGCYATRCGDEVAGLPGVIRVLPNTAKADLAGAVLSAAGPSTAQRYGAGDGACGAPVTPGDTGRTTYLLRVQTGCEERCSYCIIPATRGASRSRPIGELLHEVDRLVVAGFREVVVTGVHLGAYGRDLSPRVSLHDLLGALASMRGDVLFRISSLEPMDCSPAIVDLMADAGRFAPHFHLPLQHGSDRLLAAMRRPYTAAYYRDLVGAIRARLPHAAIGTDVIAGFPGERDDDAAALVAMLESSPVSYLHVFPYSDRPGTAAAALPDKVPGALIRARAMAIRAVGRALGEQFRCRQVGSVRPGLTIEDGSTVVTDNYLKVSIPPGLPRNERVRVRISGADPMRGEIVA